MGKRHSAASARIPGRPRRPGGGKVREGERMRDAGTHSREMREGSVGGGVAPGRPVGGEERVPVLAEVLLHLSQQLVVGHAAQSVRESRRVAEVKRHRWIPDVGPMVARSQSPRRIRERS